MSALEKFSIEPERTRLYNGTRSQALHHKLCFAPFVSMYFGRNGAVSACCYNREVVLGRVPEQTVEQIWWGPVARSFREALTDSSMPTGCQSCQQQLEAGNYSTVLARNFDRYAEPPSNGDGNAPDDPDDPGAQGPTPSLVGRHLRKLTEILGWRRIAAPEEEARAGQAAPPAQAISSVDEHTYPRAMEFELSSTCNLECVMCTGEFSSSIRQNRDGLEPYPDLYGEAFATQLEPFIPHLREAKFFGGEPFLIPVYPDIWDRMARLNPDLRVHITTNGTVLNKRIRELLEKLNVYLIVSVDSFVPQTYESIRRNGRFPKVMENLAYFESVNRGQQYSITIAVCPMVANRHEIPDIIKACNDRGLLVYFNTVWYPPEVSLRHLPRGELLALIRRYEAELPEASDFLTRHNRDVFTGLISQLKHWSNEPVASNAPS